MDEHQFKKLKFKKSYLL